MSPKPGPEQGEQGEKPQDAEPDPRGEEGENEDGNEVDRESEDSFPASDPPGHWS